MMWHIYRSIAVGWGKAVKPTDNPVHLAWHALRLEEAIHDKSELLGAFLALHHPGGTSKFKIVEGADGKLVLEAAR